MSIRLSGCDFQAELENCYKKLRKEVKFWNSFEGLDKNSDLKDFVAVLEHLNSQELKHDITVLEYANYHLEDRDVIQMFAVLLRKMRDKNHQIIILASHWNIPNLIQKEISVLDFPLPNRDNIKQLLQQIEKDFSITTDSADIILDAVRGLGTTEIWNAFAKVAVDCKKNYGRRN